VVRDVGAQVERSVEPAEEAGERLPLLFDNEPVADEFDLRRVDELRRALECDRRLVVSGTAGSDCRADHRKATNRKRDQSDTDASDRLCEHAGVAGIEH
jgi:hypothetical protein